MKISLIKSVVIGTLTIALVGISSTAAASTTEVKLLEPKRFRDIDASGLNKTRSIAILQKDLTRLFSEASDGLLEEGDILSVEVTDVDLAGYIDYFAGGSRDHIRIIKDSERYRLEFSYQVKDSKGVVKAEGEQKIKDFLSRAPSRLRVSNNQTVGYMEKELKKWMVQEFASNN